MSVSELDQPCGSEIDHTHGGVILNRFVVYQKPGCIPQTKGPFRSDVEVEEMLRGMRPHNPADTLYMVAEITHTFDLWLTDADEFLLMRENGCPLPDDDSPNKQLSDPNVG